MNDDGSDQVRLTNNSLIDQQPSWSPDGTRIAFVSERDGPYNIYIMNADGSNPTRLTTSSGDWFPVFSPDGTKIAFYSGRDNKGEVYVMNVDGSNQIRLTDTSSVNYIPAWSPDGTKIVFASDRDGSGTEIYTINADGSNPTRLTNNAKNDSQPAWSPDGTRIVFMSDRDGNEEIYVMNADGTQQKRLTNSSGDDLYPKWSHGNDRIVFSSFRDNNSEIYEMNADGSNQTRITENSSWDSNPSWTNGLLPLSITTGPARDIKSTSVTLSATLNQTGGASNVSVSFDLGYSTNYNFYTLPYTFTSPGTLRLNLSGLVPEMTYHFRAKAVGNETVYGQDLTFTTLSPAKEGKILFSSSRDGNDEIYAMNSDGYNRTRLTNNPASDREPCLSPDGKTIVFQSTRDRSNFQIYCMGFDGSNVVRLTNNMAQETGPMWSPDGSKITFTSDRDGNKEIYIMKADGSQQTRLTTDAAGDYFSSWSPDGSKIIFTSSRDGNDEIYVMNVDGTDQTRLTDSTIYEEFPVFSPDGSKIAYVSNPGTMGVSEIWVMNANGTNSTQLTNTSKMNFHLSWSPDGSKITFCGSGLLPDDLKDIWVIDADGSHPNLLTGNSQNNLDPSWSTGSWIPPEAGSAGYSNLTPISSQVTGNLFSFGSATSVRTSFQWGTSSGNYTGETSPQTLIMAASDPSLRTMLLAVSIQAYQSISDIPASAAVIACSSSAYFDYIRTALQASGISQIVPVVVPSTDVLDAVQKGVVDAAVVTTHPSSTLANSINSGQIKLLPWSGEAVTAAVQAYPLDIKSSTLPAATYTGQTQALNGFGLIGGPFNASITGLNPDTTYYVRAKAVGNGTGYSAEWNFKTLMTAVPPGGGGGGGGGSGGGGGGGGGGGAPPAPVIKSVTVTGLTSDTALKVDGSGTVQSAVQLKLEDGISTLDIARNTQLYNTAGKPLDSLTVKKIEPMPDSPEQSGMLMAYDFGPEGARFNPALTLTLKYDPQKLPAGTDGNKITLMYWNGTNWVTVESKLDLNTNAVTAKIEHFSRYALVAELMPAKFEMTDIKVSGVKIGPEGSATVQTLVSNTGGSSGEYSLVLKLDGAGTDQKKVTLGAGESQTISFALTGMAAGTYTLDINGKTLQLTIGASEGTVAEAEPLPEPEVTVELVPSQVNTTPTPMAIETKTPEPEKTTTFPVMWLIIGIVIALAVVTGLVMVLRVRRRSN